MTDSTFPDAYIHGTTPAEQERLGVLNRLLNEGELAALALRGGERVLELGAGTGLFARELARAAGARGRVVAIERDEAQLATARRLAETAGEGRALDLRRGDVLDPPLAVEEWGSFDLVHARFLLEHLRRPLDAVRVMVRAARPGGRIWLADDDHPLLRLWPEVDGFDELWALYQQEFRRIGCEPEAGRRLVEWLAQAGARPRRSGFVFFGGCAGEAHFPLAVENLAGVIASAREGIVASGGLDEAGFERMLARLRAWGRRDDAAIWYALSWAEGVRPD